jgi:hypothetical protein
VTLNSVKNELLAQEALEKERGNLAREALTIAENMSPTMFIALGLDLEHSQFV